jgi:hypothetical protein
MKRKGFKKTSLKHIIHISIRKSICDSGWNLIMCSIEYGMHYSIFYKVRDFVGDSVLETVGNSVQRSVRYSVERFILKHNEIQTSKNYSLA